MAGSSALAAEGDADLGAAEDLGGERAERLTDLGAEDQAADLVHDARERVRAEAGHQPAELGRQVVAGQPLLHRLAHCRRHPTGHRVDELLPALQGPLEPAGARPRLRLLARGRQRRHRVEPQVGEPPGVGDLAGLFGRDRPVVVLDRALRDLLGQVPVDRAAGPGHQPLELREQVAAPGAEHAACLPAEQAPRLPAEQLARLAAEYVARPCAEQLGQPEVVRVRLVTWSDGPDPNGGRVICGSPGSCLQPNPAALREGVGVVRRRRKAGTPEVVAVIGGAAGLGRALVERLAARDDLGGLIGLDTVPGRVDGVVWRTVDVRDPLLAARLVGATSVVHLATSYDVTLPASSRRALNVRGTAQLLDAAREVGARRVVLCTSSDVYGARADNAVPLLDGSPLRGEADEETLAGDHWEVERLVDHAGRAGLAVTVLRPATLVGLSAAYDGQVLRQLASPRLLAVRGVEPLWQLCHVEDLLAALELAVLGVATGGLAVGCEGALPQVAVEEMTGRRRVELPAAVALSTAERLRRAGLTTSSPRELDHLLGPLVVASDGLRAVGWEPSWTNDAALRAHLAARSSDWRVPGYTAAGATVALLGTAALVRQARRQRRRRRL